MKRRVSVLVSGRGSNLGALYAAVGAETCAAQIVAVLADRACPALELAQAHATPVEIVSPKAYPDRASWDRAMRAAIDRTRPDWVVLAGFMKIVGASVLEGYGGRIVNVHPSLLPAFPGLHAPEQAIDAAARVSGCTVHFVDAGVDTGPILAQAALPIRCGETPDALHARIQKLEHIMLPEVVDALITERLRLVDGRAAWADPQEGVRLADP